MIDRLGPFLLGPNDTPENGIYIGNARELAKAIPDESVDLIFTDPVYDRIDDYRWLAETAARVLKPDSACLVWLATPQLSEVLKAMCPPLSYAWLMYYQKFGPCYPGKPGICAITQCLWLEKGKSKTHKKIGDWFGGMREALPVHRNEHRWSKPQGVIAKWLEAFTQPGAIIVDFFTGGGAIPAVSKMLNRRWWACEIDSGIGVMAREHVRNTQPPLFVPEPEQLDLVLPATT